MIGQVEQRQSDFITPRTRGVPIHQRSIGGPGATPLGGLPGPRPDLIDDPSGLFQVVRFDSRLGQEQQHIRIPEDVDVHGIQLERVPTDATLSATALLVDVLLRAVRTGVGSVPDEGRIVQSPVLVGDAIPADRPVQPRIDGNRRGSGEIRVSGVPRRIRHGQGKAAVVYDEGIDQILCRLVKATAEWVHIREIEAFAIVGIVPIGLSIVDGGLIRQDGFLTVGERPKARPHMIEARFQVEPSAVVVPHGPQGRQGTGVVAPIHLHPSLVG